MSDILSVVIADDEKPIRDDLELFPWEDHNAVLIGMATSGEEALDLCREMHPHVLITDITMPGMDGLTLIKLLAAEQPELAVVLLTCHRNFDYIKESMKYGALDYLLKGTLEDDDITRILASCRKKILSELSLKEQKMVSLRVAQSEILLLLAQNKIQEEEKFLKMAKEKDWNISFPLSFIYLRIDIPAFSWPLLQDKIKSYLNSSGTWLTTGSGQFLLFSDKQKGLYTKNDLFSLLSQLKNLFRESVLIFPEDIPLYGVISPGFFTFSSLAGFIRRLEYWDTKKFYNPDCEAFVWDGNDPLERDLSFSLNHFLDKYRDRKESLAHTLKDKLPLLLNSVLPPPDMLKGQILQLRTLWKKKSSGSNDEFSRQVLNTRSMDSLLGLMLYDMEEECSERNNWRKEIRDAILILENEYNLPIGLSQVADRVGLTPSYLNRLFSEATARTVNEYLLEYRLNAATRLLKETTLKVYEIAEKVGIPNYRYFSMVFRKSTGYSPGDCRKDNSL